MRKIIAHRGSGNHDYAPNTKEAILTSLQEENDGVEFDVRMTKDKKIVIIHDPIISFVSDGFGIVKYMTLKQLQKYNFGTEKKPSKIGVLNDLLKEIHSNKRIMIELKEETEHFNEFMNQVYQIVAKYNNLNIYICSFNEELLRLWKEQYSIFKTCLIIGFGINHNNRYHHFDAQSITLTYQNKVNSKKETYLWTINTKEEEEKIEHPTYGILTDYPNHFKKETGNIQ